MKTWATAVFCAPAILAVLGYFGPEALDRYEQREARQADEVRVNELNQRLEELRRAAKLLQQQQQRLEELQNDARQSEDAIERWRYEHHLPPLPPFMSLMLEELGLRRGGPMPIPPTHPLDDRPIDI